MIFGRKEAKAEPPEETVAPKKVTARKTTARKTAKPKAADNTEAKDARDNTKTAAATPEAQPTPKEQRAATQKLFDKADEEGQQAIIDETNARLGALGY